MRNVFDLGVACAPAAGVSDRYVTGKGLELLEQAEAAKLSGDVRAMIQATLAIQAHTVQKLDALAERIDARRAA